MNRAWTHDNEQAIIGAVQNPVNRLACFVSYLGSVARNGKIAQYSRWR
jgi:hypothetical protein